ncbi:hypothetical protein CVT25_014764 [Psilocybe cyanescens]|uniref:Uncharacterized protein n=1 Tax=Psilocybe cyanescens TaxID=93625 RepID=A0A409X5A0_PSICY|nr:hypothetical protein CVT25_014764 [Psilocybe cyanescens]
MRTSSALEKANEKGHCATNTRLGEDAAQAASVVEGDAAAPGQIMLMDTPANEALIDEVLERRHPHTTAPQHALTTAALAALDRAQQDKERAFFQYSPSSPPISTDSGSLTQGGTRRLASPPCLLPKAKCTAPPPSAAATPIRDAMAVDSPPPAQPLSAHEAYIVHETGVRAASRAPTHGPSLR